MSTDDSTTTVQTPSLSLFDRGLPESARVLLVEDDHALSLGLSVRLRHWGLEVDCCLDGLQALEALRTRDYDLLLLDLGLPRLSGCKLLDAIRRDPDIQDLAVVVLTGSGENLSERARKHGVYEVLSKPASSEQLATAIENALTFGPMQ